MVMFIIYLIHTRILQLELHIVLVIIYIAVVVVLLIFDLLQIILLIVLGSIALVECLPELRKLSAAMGSAAVVYGVIDQVRLVTYSTLLVELLLCYISCM